MVEEGKIKIAFSRIKEDVNFLKKELDSLHSKQTNSIKKEMKDYKELLNEIKEVSQENNKRITSIKNEQEKPIKILNEELKKFDERITNIESNLNITEQKMSELSEFLSEKFDMEFGGFKLETNDHLNQLAQKIQTLESKSNTSQSQIENSLNSFSELIDEKVNLEINALRFEMTEEIGKLYDSFFNGEKFEKKTPPKPKNNSKKENSKIKKVASWFLEEEDDDLSSVKKEVKKK